MPCSGILRYLSTKRSSSFNEQKGYNTHSPDLIRVLVQKAFAPLCQWDHSLICLAGLMCAVRLWKTVSQWGNSIRATWTFKWSHSLAVIQPCREIIRCNDTRWLLTPLQIQQPLAAANAGRRYPLAFSKHKVAWGKENGWKRTWLTRSYLDLKSVDLQKAGQSVDLFLLIDNHLTMCHPCSLIYYCDLVTSRSDIFLMCLCCPPLSLKIACVDQDSNRNEKHRVWNVD